MKLAPEMINKDSGILECTYPLRNELGFKSRNIRNVGSRIWRHVPSELKESTSPNKFRFKIKTWKPENYPCKLVKYTFRELVTYKLLNQYMLIKTVIYVSFFFCLFDLLGFFFCLFLFAFCLFCLFLIFYLRVSLKLT